MNKTELTEIIAQKADISKVAASKALDATMEGVIEALKKGDTVTLVGFGTFEARERQARSGRNPKTGQTIQIKARKTPAFKAGKSFKDAISDGASR